jgi:hypothetical protein
LKEFDLNLKRKVVLKRSLKKKRKKRKTLPSHLSAQPGLPAHLAFPQQPTKPLFFFFFP